MIKSETTKSFRPIVECPFASALLSEWSHSSFAASCLAYFFLRFHCADLLLQAWLAGVTLCNLNLEIVKGSYTLDPLFWKSLHSAPDSFCAIC